MTTTLARWALQLASLLLCSAALASTESAQMDLVVNSRTTSRVLHYDGTTGAYEGLFIANGKDGASGAQEALALGADGKLYVGVTGGVMRFDFATGNGETFVSGLPATPFDLTFGPDGNLYGTLGAANQIFKASGTSGSLLCQGGGGGISFASGIGFRSDGALFVGSFSTSQVFRFDPATCLFQATFATVPGNVGGVLFAPNGNLCVSLPQGNDVYCFDGTTGAAIGAFTQDPKPIGPRLFTFGPDGNLYVTALGTNEVRRYDGVTGAFIDAFAHSNGLDGPYDLAFVPQFTDPVQPPPVDTPAGPVQGILEQGVVKYQGIPYAEAPIGARRWQRPVSKAPWAAPFDASGFGPACPQLAGSAVAGDEDCLKLSLWVPPKDPNAPPLPVMFYIHGGSLWTGSMSWPVTDGSSFALAQNAIVVEPQYRLGVFGFLGLSTLAAEDPNGSTGNYGFLDQLEALRWVRDNIAAFGGDPNQVTIAGQSAGGWSVCTLLASPLSDGLFRAGIVQSGQCMNARPLTLPGTSPVINDPYFGETITARGGHIASSTGCTDLATQSQCLRGKSPADLVQAYAALPRTLSGDAPVNPALDGYVLSEQPMVLLRNGAADHRALMIGTVANESTYFSQSWDSIITSQPVFDLFLRQAAGNTRADALEPLYAVPPLPTWAEAFRVLADETVAVCPTLDAADAATAGGSAAWVYHLTHLPTYGPSGKAGLRTFHMLDLYYVFGTYARLAQDYGIIVDPNDAALSAAMQNAWGSFVRTGVPSTTPAWPAYAPATPGDLASVSVLQFDVPNTLVSGTTFRSGRCAALFPVTNQLDPDRDIATSDEDNCPVTANTSQADAELDAVGDACDNCRNVANPRVAPDFLTTNPWATLTGGQRDDDHDGYGNLCDAKFPGVAGAAVGPADLAQFRASNNKPRTLDTCGTAGNQPCAIFDLDEANTAIGPGDLARFRLLLNKIPGPKCPTCPLACTAGTAGSCP